MRLIIHSDAGMLDSVPYDTEIAISNCFDDDEFSQYDIPLICVEALTLHIQILRDQFVRDTT